MDHKWRKDADGAESCEREGCMVRRSPVTGMWQKKRGGHWRSEREPLPPCAGMDAAPDAPSPLPSGSALAAHTSPTGRVWTRAPSLDVSAPSQLEVVRNALKTEEGRSFTGHWRSVFTDALSALATLEKSIRADELAMAITQAEDEANNHPLVSTSMRLRVRLSKLRGKAESLEKWEESIRKDEREKCAQYFGTARTTTGADIAAIIRNRK